MASIIRILGSVVRMPVFGGAWLPSRNEADEEGRGKERCWSALEVGDAAAERMDALTGGSTGE